MIFKPWTEIPTPRHILDDDDDLTDQEAANLYSNSPWARLSLTKPPSKVDILVVAAPRLAYYTSFIQDQSTIGSLAIGLTRAPPKNLVKESHIIAEGQPQNRYYDYDSDNENSGTVTPDVSETLHEVEISSALVNNLTVAIVNCPITEERFCHSIAKELINALKPSKILGLTPCEFDTSTSSSRVLYTSAVDYSDISKDIPVLEPPYMVRGLIASLVTQAECNGLPALILAVRAEGPLGHEIVHLDIMDEVLQFLNQALGASINGNIIKQRRFDSLQSGMYI